jgi:dipeptidyl aminopeptidase/acylaminoacyl peptidase
MNAAMEWRECRKVDGRPWMSRPRVGSRGGESVASVVLVFSRRASRSGPGCKGRVGTRGASVSKRKAVPRWGSSRTVRSRAAFYLCIGLLVLLGSRAAAAQSANGAGGRPLTVEDLLRVEGLGATAVSPDGEFIAVVILRAASASEIYGRPYLNGNSRADVWLISRRTGQRRNLTNGVIDASGFWWPVWSPDGRRLAMLSTRGGDNVRLFVWDKTTSRLRRVNDRGVDLMADTRRRRWKTDGVWQPRPMAWVDGTKLICAVLPKGERSPLFALDYESAARGPSEWSKQHMGRHATASALYSGPLSGRSVLNAGELIEIDVSTGRTATVATYPLVGDFRRFAMSPDAHYVALAVGSGVRMSPPDQPLRYEDRYRTRVGIAALGGGGVRWIGGIETKSSVRVYPLSWSPDASKLAVIGRSHADGEKGTVFLVSRDEPSAYTAVTPSLQVADAVWASKSQLVVRGYIDGEYRASESVTYRQAGGRSYQREDWWAVDVDGNAKQVRLTAKLDVVPSVVVPCWRHGTVQLLGTGNDALWAIGVSDDTVERIAGDARERITALVAPYSYRSTGLCDRSVIVETISDGQHGFARVDLDKQSARPVTIPVPSHRVRLVAYDQGRDFAIFSSADESGFPLERTGPGLWATNGRTYRVVRLLSLNDGLTEVADAQRLLITYGNAEGDSLTGLVLLPFDYKVGKRYPLVTWVYGGAIVRDTMDEVFANKVLPLYQSLNLEILAANGYAVLVPSIPLGPPGTGDPFLDIPKSVLPAVDRLIELGIADRNKLAVWGHSYGGYGVYSLVAYTNRFDAAIVGAGPANLMSIYGSFDPRRRFGDDAHEYLVEATISESGGLRMGSTPWTNLWRYQRNSPINYLERVQTPMLIVQGDMDYVPMTQGEEFFSGLYRLGKTAEFVRYWGEDHAIESPANVRDVWRRVLSWLEQYVERSDRGYRSLSKAR